MQPSPAAPPAAEHRRRALLRYVVFLAVSLLAFSCWALVSSRIDGAVLAATAGGEHDDHDGIIVRSSTQAEMPARGGNATSRGAVEVGVGTPAAMITRQPSSGETTTTAALAATCDAESALLRVYLYDLPPEFHFGMLGWDGKAAGAAWPDVAGDPRAVPRYPGGLNLQHSVKYHHHHLRRPPPPPLSILAQIKHLVPCASPSSAPERRRRLPSLFPSIR